jgi:hypothetical protein
MCVYAAIAYCLVIYSWLHNPFTCAHTKLYTCTRARTHTYSPKNSILTYTILRHRPLRSIHTEAIVVSQRRYTNKEGDPYVGKGSHDCGRGANENASVEPDNPDNHISVIHQSIPLLNYIQWQVFLDKEGHAKPKSLHVPILVSWYQQFQFAVCTCFITMYV